MMTDTEILILVPLLCCLIAGLSDGARALLSPSGAQLTLPCFKV
jgi:hypothetical protein